MAGRRRRRGTGELTVTPDQDKCPVCQQRPSPESARGFEEHLRAWSYKRNTYSFASVDQVEQHIVENVPRFPAPEKGYNWDEWKAAVLSGWKTWHEGAEERRRFAQETGQPWPPNRKHAEAALEQVRSGRMKFDELRDYVVERREEDMREKWLERKYPEYLPIDEIDPDMADARAKVRTFYRTVREVKSPDELEELARELLTDNQAAPRLLAAILAPVAAWRAHNRRDPTWSKLLAGD